MSADNQMSIFDQDLWFGKMCRAHCPQTEARTLEPYLSKPPESQTITPLFLDCRTGSHGLTPEPLWATDGLSLGVYTMRSFGAYPRDERDSALSQILEDRPHPRYYLSARACQGVLNRAQKRGKDLPPILKEALERQARHTPSKLGGGVETDSNGRTAGKGALVQKELSATLGTTQDQTLFCIDQGGGKGNVNISDNLSPTLSTTNDGAPVVCMDAHQHYGYRENEATGTLTAGQNSTVRGDTPLIVNAFEQTAYDKYTDTQTAPTLKQSGGNFGGGSELLVKQ